MTYQMNYENTQIFQSSFCNHLIVGAGQCCAVGNDGPDIWRYQVSVSIVSDDTRQQDLTASTRNKKRKYELKPPAIPLAL